MAIAHDTTTTAAAYSSTGTQTTSHPASASARAAVVLIHLTGTADQVSGVTYGGVAMARLGFNTEATEAGGVYIYFLDGITGGTQNVAMTTTGTAAKRLSVSTMTVAATKMVAVAGAGYATGTSASVANPSWNITGLTPAEPVVAYEVIHSGLQTMTATPQTTPAWTLITSTDLGSIGNGFARIANTPASTTLACGWIAATADDYVGASVAFKEVAIPIPVASFTADKTTIYPGESITFTDTSTNTPTSWAWTFPGGTPASASTKGPHAVQFNTAGTYVVTLQATNAGGSNTTSPGTSITVLAVVPAEVWNGTRWVPGGAEMWNGTSWRKDAEVWNGTRWVPLGTP